MIDSLLVFSRTKELTSSAKDLSKSLNILQQDVVIQKDSSEMDGSATGDASRNKPWKGFRVVFTGSLDGLTRSEAQIIAKHLGAKYTPGSVSKVTDLVVYGDKGGKKNEASTRIWYFDYECRRFLSFGKGGRDLWLNW